MPTPRALLSVWDKTGLVDFARGLSELGVELVSTGGTHAALTQAGLAVIAVADVTGFPEMLDGRVKTLHPAIHGGILADRDLPAHGAALAEHGIAPIDLVVVNLYPFREAAAAAGVVRPDGDAGAVAARPGETPDADIPASGKPARGVPAGEPSVIEMIDIGGPALVRAAAKNHRHVTVVVDPGDYARVLEALREGDGEAIAALRAELAGKAFAHTAAYDAAVAAWLDGQGTGRRAAARHAAPEPSRQVAGGESAREESPRAPAEAAAPAGAPAPAHELPERLALELERLLVPRYGENPHQRAAVYRTVGGPGIFGGFRQHQGKELSYNNLLDADAARRLVASFGPPQHGGSPLDGPAVAIVKHGNPCGVGCGETAAEAYERALACDPTSAFGSVVAVNRPADGELARAMAGLFVEVVLAPGFDAEALELFGRKKGLRVLECPLVEAPAAGPGAELELRGIAGGFLAQSADNAPDDTAAWRCATRRQPTADEALALALAWRVVRHVRSNAIVVANAHQTVGIGAGQMSRVDSCRLAVTKAELPLADTAAASDAFFPFADGLEVLAAAGITAVVQPGGSKRDADVIAAADEHGLAMLFTGRRHFRH